LKSKALNCALLTALIAALSNKDKVIDLEAFAAWQEPEPKPLD
jgi:hypothetical protein